VAWGLGANANSAKLCYLGASVDGAKPWVHFLKSFRHGIFEKIFQKKGLKNKNDGSGGQEETTQKMSKLAQLQETVSAYLLRPT
jgi:hypothetical protein